MSGGQIINIVIIINIFLYTESFFSYKNAFFNQKNCMNALKLFFCWKTRKENYSRKKNFIKHKDYMQFFIMLSLFEKKIAQKWKIVTRIMYDIAIFVCTAFFKG